MIKTTRRPERGLLIGPGAALGAALGLLFALLSGFELPLGMIFGVAVGLLLGLAVDALAAGDHHDDELHHPLMKP
jgi:hypothetical protein